MTLIVDSDEDNWECAGVLVKLANSPLYRLVAPDNTTVEMWDTKPDTETCKQALLDNGYSVPAGSHIPYRDMETEAERMPGNLTKP